MTTLAQRWMGQGNVVKDSYTLGERWAGLVDITRPILSTMGALGVAAAAVMAYGGFPPWNECLAGFVAAILAFAGIHAFNDFVDGQRDNLCWPGRPLPSRRLAPTQALILAISTFVASLAIVWVLFN